MSAALDKLYSLCSHVSVLLGCCWAGPLLHAVWNPLSWAMEVAAILAIILLDYADFALVGGSPLGRCVACWMKQQLGVGWEQW